MKTATVCLVMALLGKANFCANRHAQLCHLCCVIQNDIFTIGILLLTHFVLFSHFVFSLASTSVIFSAPAVFSSHLAPLPECGYYCGMLCPVMRPFIFWVLVYPWKSAEPGQDVHIAFHDIHTIVPILT